MNAFSDAELLSLLSDIESDASERGYVQQFGRGIGLARQHLSENGNPPPEFSLSSTLVRCTLGCADKRTESGAFTFANYAQKLIRTHADFFVERPLRKCYHPACPKERPQ